MSRAAWERRQGESARAFSLFTMYRDLAPRQRSISRVLSDLGGEAANKGRRRGDIERLCSRHEWVARAAAWDEEQDRVKREAMQAAMVDHSLEASRRHALQARIATNAYFWVIGKFWERVGSAESLAQLEEEFGEMSGPALHQMAVATGRALRDMQAAELHAVGITEVRTPPPEEPESDEPLDILSTADHLAAVLHALEEAGYEPRVTPEASDGRPG